MNKQGGFDDDFLKALGRVWVNFQTLEMDIAFLIWIMISPDTSIGQVVTSQLSFKRLCAVSYSMFRHRFENDHSSSVQRLEALLKESCAIEEERNALIHSIWFFDQQGTFSRVKFKAGLKHGFKTQDEKKNAAQLNDFAERILRASDELIKLYNDLHNQQIISSKPGLSL
jgi:hypothetical protein